MGCFHYMAGVGAGVWGRGGGLGDGGFVPGVGVCVDDHEGSGVPPVCWTLGLCGRVMVVVVLPFVWWLLSDRGVKPAGVVPGFDPPSD